MRTKYVNRIVLVFSVIFTLAEIDEYAGARTLSVYYTTEKKTPKIPPSEDNEGKFWKHAPDGQVTATFGGKKKKIKFGFDNGYIKENDKWLRLKISGLGANQFECPAAKGFWSGGCKGARTKKYAPGDNEITIYFLFHPQPDWEIITISHDTGYEEERNLTVEADSVCGEDLPTDPHKVDFNDVRISAPGAGPNDVNVTEVEIFPESNDVNSSATPDFNAPGTDGWSYEYVYVDPNGDPRPQGGVRWFTDGAGLEIGQKFSFSFETIDANVISYWLYLYDATSDEYIKHWIYTGPYPTIESIESIKDHLSNPYSIAIDDINDVETRNGGVSKLRITFGQEMDPNSTTDVNNLLITASNDPNLEYNANLTLSGPNNSVLTIQFSPALPDVNCYTINIERMETTGGFGLGESVFPIRSLVGDVTRDGMVNSEDLDEINIYLGSPVDANNAHCDINLDGLINNNDKTTVQQGIGKEVERCWNVCGDDMHLYPLGDMNWDCFTNSLDYAVLGEHWYADGCNDSNESNWCDGADINGDGNVDMFDLGKLTEHWLEYTGPDYSFFDFL